MKEAITWAAHWTLIILFVGGSIGAVGWFLWAVVFKHDKHGATYLPTPKHDDRDSIAMFKRMNRP